MTGELNQKFKILSHTMCYSFRSIRQRRTYSSFRQELTRLDLSELRNRKTGAMKNGDPKVRS